MKEHLQSWSESQKLLDVACGGRMFYFDKNDQRVLFCDNRTVETELCDGRKFIVNPDIECDFTHLPFEDSTWSFCVACLFCESTISGAGMPSSSAASSMLLRTPVINVSSNL
mgnify:CR=1 FL=1